MNQEPIIIFGTGRSGTTVFCQMLAEHPGLTWLSHRLVQDPTDIASHKRRMRMNDYPFIGERMRKRIEPLEAYPFWEHYRKGFRSPFRDLVAEDLSERDKQVLGRVMSEITAGTDKRLLLKVTGWPRVRFLKELFPDARFIHVMRDGRAVANSLLTVDFWRGWQGPGQWRWGPLSENDSRTWEDSGRSFIVLAALEWKMVMEANERAMESLAESDHMEIRYEELCADPRATFEGVTRFCGLPWDTVFEKRLSEYVLRNTNDKWRRELNSIQQEQLAEVLREPLKKYGYE